MKARLETPLPGHLYTQTTKSSEEVPLNTNSKKRPGNINHTNLLLKLLYPTLSVYSWETGGTETFSEPHDVWEGPDLSLLGFSVCCLSTWLHLTSLAI